MFESIPKSKRHQNLKIKFQIFLPSVPLQPSIPAIPGAPGLPGIPGCPLIPFAHNQMWAYRKINIIEFDFTQINFF